MFPPFVCAAETCKLVHWKDKSGWERHTDASEGSTFTFLPCFEFPDGKHWDVVAGGTEDRLSFPSELFSHADGWTMFAVTRYDPSSDCANGDQNMIWSECDSTGGEWLSG